jgi:putative membrane-bound dehydrogenase-like protein
MRGLCLAAVVVLLQAALLSRQGGGPPYSPQDALSTFRLAEGFQIELFAAEPLVADPIAMEVDEAGRVFVVEMHGYPLDVSGTGRVVMLADSDGDGKPDRTQVFADGLRLPTGIMRWKRGLIVTDPPDVWYLEDADGDGRAEIKRKILTGFAKTNPQHTMNSPVYGLDNWIYLANEGPVRTIRYHDEFGDPGTEVGFAGNSSAPHLPVDAGGRNVRFRPDTFELDMLSSRGQFGQTFDEWGHHFLNTNNRHIYQEVMPARYLSRNPALLVPNVVEQLPDYRQPADVFPITRNPEFQLLTDVGVMTAASGVTCYLADLFPPEYRHAAFVAEGAHNLVHVDALSDHGVTFRASRMFEGREFLASTDPWFRPVNFYLGPDGALYVIDYYRKILEHPEWLDETTAKSNALYEGRDRGRIYRISPRGTPPPAWMNRTGLDRSSPTELVQALANPNIWWRRHAQRLLNDRKPRQAIAPLTRMALTGASAVGRVHALWTLEGLGRLEPDLIERTLHDAVPGVRENAISLAERHLQRSPALAGALLRDTNEADPKVRFQLLLTLGSIDTPEARTIWRRLLFDNVDDDWMQIAALSAARWDALELWRTAVDRFGSEDTRPRRTLIGRVASAARTPAAIGDILRRTTDSAPPAQAWWRIATLDGLATALRGSNRPGGDFDPERELVVKMMFADDDAGVRHASLQLLTVVGLPSTAASAPLLQRAERLVADRQADAAARVDAIRLLALHDVNRYAATLRELLTESEPGPVQMAAIRALGDGQDASIAATFVQLWDRWPPAVRGEAVRAMVRDPARIPVLLDAVAGGRIKSTEIERPLRIRLMMVDDARLRERARTLLVDPIVRSEQTATAHSAVIARYSEAAARGGDQERGRQVFNRVCASCHQFRGGNGAAFGPDLGEVRNRLPAALVLDILEPNHSIADRFELWTIELSDKTTTAGVVAAETPSSITLHQPGGLETTVPRDRIVSMHIAETSAMPEGLESQIDPQAMADLIAYIKGGR